DEGAAGEVDALAQATLGDHRDQPERDEGGGDQVGPLPPAHEGVVRIPEDLDHMESVRIAWRRVMSTRSKTNRVKNTAVTRLAMMPMNSETAKPFSGPVPKL